MRQIKTLSQCLEAFKNLNTLQDAEIDALKKAMRKVKLLTADLANTKTAKSAGLNIGVRSYIMHLSPATQAFQYVGKKGTTCPKASQGCKAACLNTAGRGRFDSIQNSRVRKTLYYILFKKEFLQHLVAEISKLKAKADRDGVKLAIRLNGTSDLPLHLLKVDGLNIFDRFKTVQFYDYTKVFKYLEVSSQYENWHVTFSASESNDAETLKALKQGHNVAAVFETVPTQWQGFETIDGDAHDLRFLDRRGGFVVALQAKGKAKKDASGFVKRGLAGKSSNAA